MRRCVRLRAFRRSMRTPSASPGTHTVETLELIHRTVAYPFAFVVAPLALATFAGAPGHRRTGQVYLWVMVFLYLTGTAMTLTRHEWSSWGFARNVAFNFAGFSLVLYGARAIVLFRRPEPVAPGRVDFLLGGLLVASAAALFLLGLFRDTPVRVFALLVGLLAWLEVRELRAGFRPRVVLLHRHVRYILASYFYVLTVASIVHLGDELPRDLKWLWPSLIGGLFVWAATTTRSKWLRRRRRWVLRGVVAITILLAIGFGGYAMWEVSRELRGGPAVTREP